jgi:pantetheine-phosphate adenylyltransferase
MVKVVLGGTFDVFHRGHRHLLERALAEGNEILVGLTSDEFAEKSRSREVVPYEDRLLRLKKFLDENATNQEYFIFPIDDPYGHAAWDDTIEVLLVSEETRDVADEINQIRSDKGLPPLKVKVASLMRADDGSRISATRIRRGEMDTEGNVPGNPPDNSSEAEL